MASAVVFDFDDPAEFHNEDNDDRAGINQNFDSMFPLSESGEVVEKWVLLANKIIISRVYFWVYIGVIALSLVSLIWALVDPRPENAVFWIVEFLVVFALVFEVGITMLAQGYLRYFSNWSNRIDFGITVVCLLSVILHVVDTFTRSEKKSKKFEELELTILIIRNLIQVVRLTILVKNQAKSSQPITQIDFRNIRSGAFEEDFDDQSSVGDGLSREDLNSTDNMNFLHNHNYL